jgi:hypothetical protein
MFSFKAGAWGLFGADTLVLTADTEDLSTGLLRLLAVGLFILQRVGEEMVLSLVDVHNHLTNFALEEL